MAEERQKRLLIKEYDLVCDLNDCKYCEEKDWCSEKDGITRQEAIELMAKAMCRRDYRISCDKCIYKNSKNCKTILGNWFIEDAEAALNAIAPMIPQEEEK